MHEFLAHIIVLGEYISRLLE